MKKVILTITAAVCTTLANAANVDELLAAKASCIAQGMLGWEANAAVYASHTADFKAAFNEWVAKPIAKYSLQDNCTAFDKASPYNALSLEEKKKADKVRVLLLEAVQHDITLVGTIPYRTSLLVGSKAVYDKLAESNPTFYTELKAADFVVDGVKLPSWTIGALVDWAGDADAFYGNIAAKDGIWYPCYTDYMCKKLLASSDISAAKVKAGEIENAYIVAGKTDDTGFVKIQAVNRVLTSRLVDSKILGK